MKIVVMEPIGAAKETLLKIAEEKLEAPEVVCYDSRTTDVNELIQRVSGCDVLVLANQKLPVEVLQACPTVKLISVAFTGVDHIPMDYCHENNIIVSNCAGYSNTAVSELVICMALTLARKVTVGNEKVRQGGTSAGLLGTELKGKRFGIVGTGAIGLRTAELARAFGCEVYAYSRTVKELDGITYTDLDTLMGTCDIISLHVPLNASTRGLIGAHEIGLMKKNAVLINTARGPVVDGKALAEALTAGNIAGAGIDVFETEPPIDSANPLLSCPNTVLTPHVGFATKEALEIRAGMVFDNIAAWCSDSPINVM